MYGEVVRTQRLSPELIRVVLGGSGLAEFEPSDATDAYVNCFFVPEGAGYQPPFEPQELRDQPDEQRPRPRRITVRRWDAEAGELTLDIAAHGDVGYAGRWAISAKPGDLLQFRGPGGGYVPHADADAYLLVGDESALPAIAASLEAVPEGRPVVVVAEIEAGGEVALDSPGELTVHWIPRSDGGTDEHRLADAVAALPSLGGIVSAFVHGEASATRAVRRVLLRTGRVQAQHLSCSPYWCRGLDDEEWRRVKGDWVREVNAEVFAPPAG